MRRYLDLVNFTLQKQLTGSPVASETIRRGATWPYELQFVRAGVVLPLADGATGLLRLVIPGSYTTPQNVVTASFEKIGDLYKATALVQSAALDAQLANADSATFALELTFTSGSDTIANANAVSVVVRNSGNRASLNAAAEIPLANVTRLQGGLPATDLDAQPVDGYAVGSIFSVVIDQGGEVLSESRWRKVASTAPTNLANGVIRVAGFNAFTNAFVLVRVGGA